MRYKLVGIDSDTFSIINHVLNAMKDCKLSEEEQKEYQNNATSGDYSTLLLESIKMIDKCNEIANS